MDWCPFCQIVKNEKRLTKVNQSNEAAITIDPLNPVTDGHQLVIPRQHAQYIWELEPKNLAYTMFEVASTAWVLRPCNIIQSNGAEATQTIDHVHFHIVPRREGDGLKLPWS